MPLLVQLETQLAVQEDDSTIVATYFPTTSAFIQSWGVLKDEITTLDAAMKRGLDRTQERISSIAQQLYSTESLRDQVSSSISFSSMLDSAQKCIKSKKEGILHPIRRLPLEILLHIFEDCVNDERHEYDCDPPSFFQVRPTMALRLASVCSSWRDIMLGTPYLWRHIRGPTWDDPDTRRHFQNYLDRCGGDEIELSIPPLGANDLDLDTMTVQRLNVELEEGTDELPTFLPSPVHLWLYNSEPVSILVVPSDLISRTTHLTVWNTSISFQEDCKSLTRLEICGFQLESAFPQIIRQLQ